ncbi:hypothetical protein ACSF86_08655 [Moraxella bovoculi]|uniref:hypothetical protein n=1 Tax=Moraxella bovoculi TaxID=386891 RepID=UPI003F4FBBB0
MTNQVDNTINIAIKEVEIVEVGKEKHDEMLAGLANKAEKSELEQLKSSVEASQEQLQTQSEKIDTKLDETQVKALIAEAELDDLTLEQVQQEVIRQVADKASTQAVSDANEAQDAKIGEIARSVETKADKEHTHTVDDITGLNEKFYAMFEDDTFAQYLNMIIEGEIGETKIIVRDLMDRYFGMGEVRNAIQEAILEERRAAQEILSELGVLTEKVKSLESALADINK